MSVVLVVEDDSDLLQAISEGLAEEGWTVLGAGSVDKALELARTHQVDVVFSDLRIADGRGQVLQRTLRSRAGGPPIVFMTGLSLRGRELDPSTVIAKPFNLAEAAAALRRASSQDRLSNTTPSQGYSSDFDRSRTF